jgi:TRAP-type C4-dicarboxylate transport system permease small subunit
MKKIQKILNVVHLVVVFSSMIFMACLVIIIFVHVILRYGFNSGLSWSEEVASRVLIPTFVFLGMAIGIEEDLHININVIPKKIPKWFDTGLKKLKHICNLIIGVILVIFGIILFDFTSKSILPATEWPASLQYIVMPVAGLLIIAISVLYLFNIPRDEKLVNKILNITNSQKGD